MCAVMRGLTVCVQPCGNVGSGKWKLEKPRGSKKCPGAGQPLLYQHDGMCPHTTKINGRVFAGQGKAKGFDIQVFVQAGQNPDLNADALAFLHSLQTDVSPMVNETRKGAQKFCRLWKRAGRRTPMQR